MKKILVIDDNITICLMLKSWLTKNNYIVDTASSVEEAIEMVQNDMFDLVLSDIRMPGADGFSFLSWIQKFDSSILVIMMTSFADINTAVESLKMGAVDYISKPIDADVLFSKIEEALRKSEVDKQVANMQQAYIRPEGMGIESEHNKLIEVIRNLSHLLIIGSEGTGKSTSVRFIYTKGLLKRGPLVQFDLNGFTKGNISEETYSQLFNNHFVEARGGLLHIKGFKKIGLQMQTNLLRALTKQNRDENFTQIIITTTDSKEQLKEYLIPKLYDVLMESCMQLKDINGNVKGIESFAKSFIDVANRELNRSINRIDNEVYEAMFEHDWEGNIQSLKNMVFKMVLATEGNTIKKDVLHLFSKKESENRDNLDDKSMERFRKENFEKKKISEALEIAKGNKTLAATLLNIDRKTLYNKIRLYNI